MLWSGSSQARSDNVIYLNGLPFVQQVVEDYVFPDPEMKPLQMMWFDYFNAQGEFYTHSEKTRLSSDVQVEESWSRGSLHPAKMVCTELANGIFNEGTNFTAEMNNEVFQEWVHNVDLQTKCNRASEWACALGTSALLLKFGEVLENGTIANASPDNVGLIRVDARNIYPIANTEDEVFQIAFVFPITYKAEDIFQVSVYSKDGEEWEIRNHWFRLMEDERGTQKIIEVATDMANYVRVPGIPFALLKPAVANTYSVGSCLGVSVFDGAIPAIELVDLGFENFLNDLEKGQKMIFLDEGMVKGKRGSVKLPFRLRSVFVDVDRGIGEGSKHIDEYNPSLRAAENKEIMSTALATLGLRVGFGPEHWQFDRTGRGIQTATAAMMDRQDLVLTFKRHENSFRKPLEQMLETVMSVLGTETSVSIQYDDSILQDTDRQREIDRQEVAAGLMPRWAYIQKWNALDEDEARRWADDSIE